MKKHLSNQTRKRMLSILGMLLLSVPFVLAQVLVKGTVKDNLGEGVPGASVQVKGTSQGTITDLDGKFTLNIPQKNATLVISFIGYVTVELKADSQKPMVITLKEDTKTLDEVVVVGYQEVRRRDLTGSVAKANMADVLTAPVASFDQALGGRIAGVNVTSGEGMPGGNMSIVIRGNNSLTQENSPLFVIDGFPIEDSSAASTLNPSDIESLDFLKDASATAIYGARGANGVVIITTKKGKVGRAQLSYDGSFGVQHVTRTIPMMDAYEFVKLQNEMYPTVVAGSYLMNYEGKQWTLDDYKDIPQYNWQDEIFKTAWQQNHTVRLAGGTEGVRYNASLSYFDQDGTLIETGYKRMQGRMNTVVRRGKLNMSLTTNYSRSIQTGSTPSSTSYSGMNNLFYSVWGYRPVTSPDTPLSFLMDSSTDNAVDSSNDYRFNPIKSQKNEYRKSYTNNLQMNGFAEYEVLKGLKLKVSAGYTYDSRKQDQFNNSNTRYGGPTSTDKVNAQVTRQERLTWLNENTLTYQTNIKKKHFLNVLGGITFQNSDYEIYSFRTTHIPNESLGMAGMSEGQAGTTTSAKSSWAMLSYLGRVTYNYMSKYYATVSFRADGSSKFSKDNRWGYFPSAAVAWRISSESFMEKTHNWLDDLKLRFSYGTAGNNNIPSDQTSPVWSSSSTTWLNQFPSYWTSGIASGQSGSYASNPDLKWETTITRNMGLDYTLFGGKLTGSFEYYWNTTKDLLIAFPVSGSGYDYQYRNLGETENKGFEVSLTWNAINTKNYGLTFSGNVGFNKNKVKSLGSLTQYSASSGWASTQIQDDYIVKPGHSVGEIYGYISDGRYEVSDFEDYYATGEKWVLKEGVVNNSSVIGTSYLRPGALKLKNMNDDNVIDAKDRTVIGNTNPKASGGFSLSGRVYGFDLSANFTYSIGNDVYNANKIEYTSSYQYYYRNMLDIMGEGKRWTNLDANGNLVNDPAQLAALNANTTMWSPYTSYVLTDWAIEDGSFLRLSTLTLGYTLPLALTKKVGINNLRFYATCYNVFCLTGYSGFDPEVSTRNKTALTPGVDYSAYPKSRQFVIGVNLNF